MANGPHGLLATRLPPHLNGDRVPKSTAASSTSASKSAATSQRTYVLDTSVLLSDPRAIFRFAEHEVVLPVVVVSELEKKRNDPNSGISPDKRCGTSTICGSSTNDSTCRSRWVTAVHSA